MPSRSQRAFSDVEVIAPSKDFRLLQGDCTTLMPNFPETFNMIFADPPYFLSNDGLTVKNGKVASVNKGDWDRSLGAEVESEFTRRWLALARDCMKDNATIWISGTSHNIFLIGMTLQDLGFKILNTVTWQKTNPPPNFSCRYFTHSTEQIIWARKHPKVPHKFNYDLMKRLNGGKQMKDVWPLPAIGKWEKEWGKHPTQKPLSVLSRIVLASTAEGDNVLDPFTGSSTTGIASSLFGRRFLGIDQDAEYLELSEKRYQAIRSEGHATNTREKLGLADAI